MNPWEITLLGGLTARCGTTVIDRWRSVRVRSLVGYLALHRTKHHDRASLAQEIWGEDSPAQRPADPDNASALLTQELSRLRRHLTPLSFFGLYWFIVTFGAALASGQEALSKQR